MRVAQCPFLHVSRRKSRISLFPLSPCLRIILLFLPRISWINPYCGRVRFRLSCAPAKPSVSVSQYFDVRDEQLPGQLRLVLGAISLGLALLFALAAIVQPSPYHLGTHQELGLPPCSFLVLFGVPCPTCGMTTAWACLMHGDLPGAFRANSGGALLAFVSMAAAPWLLISAVSGRWLILKPRSQVAAYLSMGILAITLAQWAFHLLQRLNTKIF
jgi:hypothetical protein